MPLQLSYMTAMREQEVSMKLLVDQVMRRFIVCTPCTKGKNVDQLQYGKLWLFLLP
jgi:hypothetical protein